MKAKILTMNLDRVTARVGLLLTACLPILAIVLTSLLRQRPRRIRALSKTLSSNGSDQRLIEFCSRNVKSNRAFVVFQHGTCVVVENESNPEAIKSQAIALLRRNSDS